MQGDPDETAELDGPPVPEEAEFEAVVDEIEDDELEDGVLDTAELDEEPGAEPDPPAEPLDYEPWAPPVRRHRWLARILVLAAVLLPAVAIVAVVKQATSDDATAADERLANRLRYDGEGNPLVLTPIAKLGSVKQLEWRVCGAECDAISGRGREFQPGEVLAGSRVQVRVVAERGAATIVTPNWDGQLRNLTRPTLTGSPVIGSTVTANPGKWTGGWIGGRALLGVRACPTKAGGAKCIAFTSSIIDDRHRPTRTIPESFRGWWIGAIEWQIPPGRTLEPSMPNPDRPTSGRQAPQRSVAVALGPLDGPIG